MLRLTVLSALAIFVCLRGTARAREGAGKFYANERWGFKRRVPGGRVNAAHSADEKRIASEHFAQESVQAKEGMRMLELAEEMDPSDNQIWIWKERAAEKIEGSKDE